MQSVTTIEEDENRIETESFLFILLVRLNLIDQRFPNKEVGSV